MSAFTELLQSIPENTGLAFLIIQHLLPEAKSSLSEILAGKTRLSVQEVEADTPVEPNHIYVLPANKNIIIENKILKLSPRKNVGLNLPIDIFFTSLANQKKHRRYQSHNR